MLALKKLPKNLSYDPFEPKIFNWPRCKEIENVKVGTDFLWNATVSLL